MRILCVIDHFGSGGAQRQMVTLACGLKQRGHDVEFFIYYPDHSHFADRVVACGIPIHEVRKGRGFSFHVVRRLISQIRTGRYDIVLSYMASPNIYAELSRIVARSARLVVSERGSHFGDTSRSGALVKRNLHRLADHIVVNSSSHQQWLLEQFPWMSRRLSVIYNGFEMAALKAAPLVPATRDLRLIAVGRVHPGKNVLVLIEALQLFYTRHGWLPSLSWVGRRESLLPSERSYCDEVDALLERNPQVKGAWDWLGERQDVPHLLREHHALIHASLHEGLPNAVCEALAAGRPVLAAAICDNPILVADGERGFLFEPTSAESMCAAIEKLAQLDEAAWIRMSASARQFAETRLSVERLVDDYETLFLSLTRASRQQRAA